MRIVLVFLFIASSAVAQTQPTSRQSTNSCGPSEVTFHVKLDKSHHSIPQPDSGKALVVVIEVFEQTRWGYVTPTVRVGLDGKWIGANRGSSYFFFSVDPGEHHLCASWQSPDELISGRYSLTNFVANPGAVYFFRAEPHSEAVSQGGEVWSKDLELVNPDEAKYLVANSRFSVSTPRM